MTVHPLIGGYPVLDINSNIVGAYRGWHQQPSIFAVGLALHGAASAQPAAPHWPEPAVSFWYDAGTPSDWPALLGKVGTHKDVITSVILFCGVSVAPGGAVVGNISTGCATSLIPSLLKLGVRVEMTVESGTSDVRDYRRLFFADPQPLARRLATLGKAHGLSGWK